MASITEFLETRIAEDEKKEASKFRVRTEELHAYKVDHMGYVDFELRDGLHYGRLTGHEFFAKYGEPVPDQRALAECAAKRSIIHEHDRMSGEPWQTWRHKYCATCAGWEDEQLGEGPPNIEYPCPTLRSLAAVYADHPDYQQEWS